MALSKKAKVLQTLILKVAEDQKAVDIQVIPLPSEAGLGEFMIIASGTSNRHVITIADYICRALKEAKVRGIQVNGMETGDWVVIDAQQGIVHIFRPEVRAYYDIESLWTQTPLQRHASAHMPEEEKKVIVSTGIKKPTKKPTPKKVIVLDDDGIPIKDTEEQ